MPIKLAEALLIRKELSEKVERLKQINAKELYDTQATRRPAAEGIDDIVARVAKMSFQQFTHCYDWHAKRLRQIDALIQQANWNTELNTNEQDFTSAYVDPYVQDDKSQKVASV